MGTPIQLQLAAIDSQTTVGDLVPYLVVLGAGFLVGAWGNSAKSPIVTLAGLLLVLAAIVGFIIEFPVCPDGTQCF
jgi:hypothetical protein